MVLLLPRCGGRRCGPLRPGRDQYYGCPAALVRLPPQIPASFGYRQPSPV